VNQPFEDVAWKHRLLPSETDSSQIGLGTPLNIKKGPSPAEETARIGLIATGVRRRGDRRSTRVACLGGG